MNEDFCESIAQGASLQRLRREAKKQEYTTIYYDGLQKVVEGVIDFDALLDALGRVAAPPELQQATRSEDAGAVPATVADPVENLS